MIAAALALVVAPTASFRPTNPSAANPSPADKALLLRASRACHLHPGAAYFVQYSRLSAPAIHITHALGDSDAKIVCVLQSLPADFMGKYALDAEAKVRKTRRPKRR